MKREYKIDTKREMLFFYKTLMQYITFFGSYLFGLLAVIALYLMQQKLFAVKLLFGGILLVIIEYAIKLFYKEKRPDFYKDHEKALFERFQERSSFPSGHSGLIALFTTLLFRMYGNLSLTLMFAVIAVLVGLSRMYLKRHYVIDVIAGYAIGIVIAILI